MRKSDTNGLDALAALASAAPAPTNDASEGGADTDSAGGGTASSEEKTQSQAEALPGSAAVAAAVAAGTTVANSNLASPATQQQQVASAVGQQQHTSPAAAVAYGTSLASAPELAYPPLQRRASDPSVALAMHTAYMQLLLQQQQQTQTQPHLAAALHNPAVSAAFHHGLMGLNQGTTVAGRSITGAPSAPSPTGRMVFGAGANAPVAPSPAVAAAPAVAEAASSSMPPPPPSAPTSPSLAQPPLATAPASRGAAPAFPRNLLASSPTSSKRAAPSEDEEGDAQQNPTTAQDGDKKEQKRAANRRSAQLSRKRKKQFIEELKDENDDLRRKEQILKSIPDLVVVFDSTGKLWFVSQSISRFVRFKADELEGKSFWDRLCSDSVRLLKAAFMDSLAARGDNQTDTVPLGDGLWDLRLIDKDGSFITVTLNGVVHFAGERPECVCCIRPKDNSSLRSGDRSMGEGISEEVAAAAAAAARGAPGQAVVSDMSTAMESGVSVGAKAAKPPVLGNVGATATAIRISDSGNSSGSGESESGSSDELGARA